MTSEQAAYLAGAIDGEGWVGLGRKAPNSETGRRSPTYTASLTIANTNREWLETLSRWIGGRIYQTEADGSRNRRACHMLVFRNADIKAPLLAVMPYLLVKKRQAELLFAYLETAARRRVSSRNATQVDSVIVLEQECIYQEIRRLNRRGSSAVNWKLGGKRSERRCLLDGCESKHYGHGYCWIHYRKYIIRGGPAWHELTCKQCGAPFTSKRSDANCCSKKCSDERYYAANSERIKTHVAEYKQRRKQATEKQVSNVPVGE